MRSRFHYDSRGRSPKKPTLKSLRCRAQAPLLKNLSLSIEKAEMAVAITKIDTSSQDRTRRVSIRHGQPPYELSSSFYFLAILRYAVEVAGLLISSYTQGLLKGAEQYSSLHPPIRAY